MFPPALKLTRGVPGNPEGQMQRNLCSFLALKRGKVSQDWEILARAKNHRKSQLKVVKTHSF